jgi:hypothetical protein
LLENINSEATTGLFNLETTSLNAEGLNITGARTRLFELINCLSITFSQCQIVGTLSPSSLILVASSVQTSEVVFENSYFFNNTAMHLLSVSMAASVFLSSINLVQNNNVTCGFLPDTPFLINGVQNITINSVNISNSSGGTTAMGFSILDLTHGNVSNVSKL